MDFVFLAPSGIGMRLQRKSTLTNTKVRNRLSVEITNQYLLKKIRIAEQNEARQDFARRAKAIFDRYHEENEEFKSEVLTLHLKQH